MGIKVMKKLKENSQGTQMLVGTTNVNIRLQNAII
jgi:hypothetical protein